MDRTRAYRSTEYTVDDVLHCFLSDHTIVCYNCLLKHLPTAVNTMRDCAACGSADARRLSIKGNNFILYVFTCDADCESNFWQNITKK